MNKDDVDMDIWAGNEVDPNQDDGGGDDDEDMPPPDDGDNDLETNICQQETQLTVKQGKRKVRI